MLVSHSSLDQTTLSFALNPKTYETREIRVRGSDLSFKIFSFPLVNLGQVGSVQRNIQHHLILTHLLGPTRFDAFLALLETDERPFGLGLVLALFNLGLMDPCRCWTGT
jgi:hypothetical protein